jgi:hypothetical protein
MSCTNMQYLIGSFMLEIFRHIYTSTSQFQPVFEMIKYGANIGEVLTCLFDMFL